MRPKRAARSEERATRSVTGNLEMFRIENIGSADNISSFYKSLEWPALNEINQHTRLSNKQHFFLKMTTGKAGLASFIPT